MKTNFRSPFLRTLNTIAICALVFWGCGEAPKEHLNKNKKEEAAAKSEKEREKLPVPFQVNEVAVAAYTIDSDSGIRLGWEMSTSNKLDQTFIIRACDGDNKCADLWTIRCSEERRLCERTGFKSAGKLERFSPTVDAPRNRILFTFTDSSPEAENFVSNETGILGEYTLQIHTKGVVMNNFKNWPGFRNKDDHQNKNNQ